jgi:hypothetical protein
MDREAVTVGTYVQTVGCAAAHIVSFRTVVVCTLLLVRWSFESGAVLQQLVTFSCKSQALVVPEPFADLF